MPAKTSIPLLRNEGRQEFPLSFAQRRLWFLDQMGAGSAYHIPLAIRLRGPLDVASLERALQEIVRRHEILRTCFPVVGREPVQRIAASLDLALPCLELKARGHAEQEAEALRLAIEEAERPFELAKGPLLRARLLRLDHSDHALLLTFHHIVWDRWSTGILFRELTSLYEAFSQGRQSPLAGLSRQYGDFALWQHEALKGPNLDRLLSFWKPTLAGLAPLSLPTDRPRPARQSYECSVYDFDLPIETWEGIRKLSNEAGMTLAMVLMAAWQVILLRYSGQEDLAVGLPIASRARVEVEPLMGAFVNTLVMRSDLSGDPSFLGELLPRVKEVSLAAYEHQDMPFEKLVEELNPQRDASRNPLFQALFSMQNRRRETLKLGALQIDALGEKQGTPERARHETIRAQIDLELRIIEHASGLSGRLIYDVDLFDHATVARMSGHLLNLLAGVVAEPHARLSRLPLMQERETRQALVEWNDTAADYPRRCAHEIFEGQAQREPQRVAVEVDGETLSYGELDSRANRLAQRLLAAGLRLEDIVGVAVDRSLDLAVCLLAVHKAGGVYLPLDPDYPAARLAYMIDEAKPRVVLTQRGVLESLQYRCETVLVDDAAESAKDPGRSPQIAVETSRLAYVVYTSGSRGSPKGVQIEHRSLVNELLAMQKRPGLSCDDVLLAVTSFSFDVAVLDLLLPLITGAKLVIAKRATGANGPALAAELERVGATLCQATPTRWQMLLDSGWRARGPLKALCGGEPMPPALARQLLSDPNVQLWNMYGPTETTIWCAAQNVTTDKPPIPIGHAIDNTQLYVLDAHLQPVPIGVPGELFIGGDGIARGYLNRPELTAASFLVDPFRNLHGARIYKTSDRVRRLSDGSIEFLGRADDRIKLRGYLIEPAEVEHALRGHPSVAEAVVVRRDEGNQARLVAYIVPVCSSRLVTTELRSFLGGILPAPMVPAHFVELSALPLNPNGKIDRRALPDVPEEQTGTDGFEEPASPAEQAIAAIWEAMLPARPRVGRHDYFLDLGGHSLLAMTVLARIEQELDVKLRPADILFGNLAQVAKQCEPHLNERGRALSWLSRAKQRLTGETPS